MRSVNSAIRTPRAVGLSEAREERRAAVRERMAAVGAAAGRTVMTIAPGVYTNTAQLRAAIHPVAGTVLSILLCWFVWRGCLVLPVFAQCKYCRDGSIPFAPRATPCGTGDGGCESQCSPDECLCARQ